MTDPRLPLVIGSVVLLGIALAGGILWVLRTAIWAAWRQFASDSLWKP